MALMSMGTGIVSQPKRDGSKGVTVFSPELFPFHEGEVTSDHETIYRTGVDLDGNVHKVTLQRSMSLNAVWHGDGHRTSSPNVKPGEQVELFTNDNSGRVLWKEVGRDNHLRKSETIEYAVKAKGDTSNKLETSHGKNSYLVAMDGTNGHITVSTSASNGEKVEYKLQINGKEGHITVADNVGNMIQMDSVNDKITSVNSKGTSVILDKDTLKFKAKKIIFEGDEEHIGNSTSTGDIDSKTLHGRPIEDAFK